MTYVGLRATGSTIFKKFTTVNAAGVPFTLAGAPVVSVYKNQGVAESTAGVTLTVDFDGVAGLNHVEIDTSAGPAFYSADSDFDVVITTGAVDGSSVVGYTVFSFSLAHNPRGVLAAGTAQGGDTSEITLAAGESATDDIFVGGAAEIVAGTGAGQTPRIITSYNGTTKVATVEPNWVITPDATSVYRVLAVPPSAGLEEEVLQALTTYDAADNSAVAQVTTDVQADIAGLNDFDPATQHVLSDIRRVEGQDFNSNKPFDVP